MAKPISAHQVARRSAPGSAPSGPGRSRPASPATKTPQRGGRSSGVPGGSFADALKEAQAPSKREPVNLSAHAQKRLRQRGISLDGPQRQALGQAMQQLEAKGARDAVVMRDDAAFVVNVPNRTVVTAMNNTEMKQRAFTQIDSAMML